MTGHCHLQGWAALASLGATRLGLPSWRSSPLPVLRCWAFSTSAREERKVHGHMALQLHLSFHNPLLPPLAQVLPAEEGGAPGARLLRTRAVPRLPRPLPHPAAGLPPTLPHPGPGTLCQGTRLHPCSPLPFPTRAVHGSRASPPAAALQTPAGCHRKKGNASAGPSPAWHVKPHAQSAWLL